MNVVINESNIESCRTILGGDLEQLLGGISRYSIARMVKRGELPKPIKLGGTNHWLESEIMEFIQSKHDAAKVAA